MSSIIISTCTILVHVHVHKPVVRVHKPVVRVHKPVIHVHKPVIHVHVLYLFQIRSVVNYSTCNV